MTGIPPLQGEQLLRMALRVSRIGVWWMDFELDPSLHWSPELYQMLELPLDYCPVLETEIDRFVPKYQEQIRAAFDACALKGEAFDIECEIFSGKGRQMWVRFIAEAVRNEAGKIIRVQGAFQDISAQKAAEESLESITDGFFTLDSEWRFRFLNSKAQRLLKKEKALLLGNSIWDVFPEVVGTDLEKEFRQASTSQTTSDFEFLHPAFAAWFEVRVYPSNDGLAVYFRDVTRRRKNREQRQLLETSIARISDMVLITEAEPIDEPGPRIVYVNDSFLECTGYCRDEVLGKTPRILQGPKTQRPALQRIRKALQEKKAIREELINYTKDGKEFWVGMEVVPVHDKAGTCTHFIAIQRDITEAKNAESALLLSEERFRLLASATNDAVWDWDLAANSLWWNEGFEKLFGFQRAEVEGGIESWTNRIHPDELERVVSGIDGVIKGRTESWSDEYRFRRKDGGYAYVLDLGHVIRDESGKAVRMVGGMTDLTERKRAEEDLQESEERFRTLLQDLPTVAVQGYAADGTVQYWNEASVRLYGYSQEEALGKNLLELIIPPEMREEVADRLKSLQETGVDLPPEELQLLHKDGSRIHVLSSHALLRRPNRPVELFCIDIDLTERKKMEQQFLRTQRLESIGTLAAGIAHDLNNLLAPILMGTGLIRQLDTPGSYQKILDTIEQSTKRGTDLVKQILSFARGIEGERLRLSFSHLIEELAFLIENTFPKNITFESDLAPDLKPVVGDPTQIHQVLLNLCLNSKDAMPDGGKISVSASNVTISQMQAAFHAGASPGAYVLITVADSGQGMSREVVDRIWEPFFTTKELGKGTGLGLPSALNIIKSHRGFLNVYSEEGRGTAFKIYLPVKSATSGNEEDDIASDVAGGRGEVILVVDDEQAILDITKRSLEAFGYKVLVAADGFHAASIYAEHYGEIALVLTDMMMPTMDGAELIRQLRIIDPNVRIVASSGLRSNGEVARAATAGVDRFLAKPYSTETMLTVIRQALDSP